jgi:uncharacterized protein YciI
MTPLDRLLLIGAVLATSLSAQPGASNEFLVRLDRVDPNVSLQTLGDEGRRIGAEHLAYWNALLREGRLAIGGQAFDDKGMFGVLILTAPTREAAADLVNADPFVKAKVVRGSVIPFRTFFKPGCPGVSRP